MVIKKKLNTKSNRVDLIIEDSKYKVSYPKDKPFDFKITVGNEDITAMVGNNLIVDMILALDDMLELEE